MKFHKGCFPIQGHHYMPERIKVVEGWIEESNTYGFYKYGKVWKATDLMSGTLIITLPTRKACVEWIEENSERIEKAKETQNYRIKVDDFKILIEEELHDMCRRP